MARRHIDHLRLAFRSAMKRHPFSLDAIVVLPDHLHALWTLPAGDHDFATRGMLIKGHFSRHMPVLDTRNASRRRKGERGIWQRRYWEHQIRDERDYQRHADYIHYNPVKHGYVPGPMDWPYSSIHRYVRLGVYGFDWGRNVIADDSGFGERRDSTP
jgi:putative transposase